MHDASDSICWAHKIIMVLDFSGTCRRCGICNLTMADREENQNSVIDKIRNGKFEIPDSKRAPLDIFPID